MHRQGPRDMFPDQWRGGVLAAGEGVERFRAARCVAKGDSNVAQPALVADAAYRAASQTLGKILGRPGKKFAETGRVERMPCGEIGISQMGETVPRAA